MTVASGLSKSAVVRRLDQALAPTGIRAIRDRKGDLVFSVDESSWPAVRDTLAIKGEGRRFPTGQFNHVRAVAETPAARPESWSASDAQSLQRTLQEVRRTRDGVSQARQVVSQALAEAAKRLPSHTEATPDSGQGAGAANPATGAPATDDARWSSEFTDTFAAIAEHADYPMFAALAPALTGVNRQRVEALLSLP
jgi:hypothetical protein